MSFKRHLQKSKFIVLVTIKLYRSICRSRKSDIAFVKYRALKNTLIFILRMLFIETFYTKQCKFYWNINIRNIIFLIIFIRLNLCQFTCKSTKCHPRIGNDAKQTLFLFKSYRVNFFLTQQLPHQSHKSHISQCDFYFCPSNILTVIIDIK